MDKKCRFRNSDSYLVHCICLYHISTASSPIQVSTFHGQLKSKSNFNHHQHGIASKFFYEFSYLFCPLHQTHFRMKTCPDCSVQTKRIVTITLLKKKKKIEKSSKKSGSRKSKNSKMTQNDTKIKLYKLEIKNPWRISDL